MVGIKEEGIHMAGRYRRMHKAGESCNVYLHGDFGLLRDTFKLLQAF